MSFTLRQISFTADGREIVRASTIEKTRLSVGRSAENDVHLPDLAIAPDHARIALLGERKVAVRATGTLGFDLDGRTVLQAEVDSGEGAELGFGSHRITVSHEPALGVVLSVQRGEAMSDASREKDEGRVFSLRGLLPGKRLSAWALVLGILVAFLAVPIWSYASRPGEDQRNIHTVKGDAAWSPGPLSQAHHALEGKCESCHQKAFVSVRDSACATCHKDVHDHAPPARIARAREAPGLGGQLLASVAGAFGKPGPGACVDCHSEHEGAGPMPPTPQVFCTDCHASLRSRLGDTPIGDAGDFGTSHPEFRPQIVTASGPHPRFERRLIDGALREESGLKFPHALHLAQAGGVARMARTMKGEFGFGDVLGCKDCHRPTADGVRFLPVDMERDCQMCHSLAFDKVDGTVRTLRHGDPAQVAADIRALYRSTGPAQPLALSGAARRRPGLYAQGQLYHAYFGAASARPAQAEAAVRAVFTKGGACYDCHSIAPPGANGIAGWQVTPVHQPMRYMMKGWFDHGAHKSERCESCHAAPKSNSASDVLLPGIAVCRDCHGGEQAKADVPSACALCHSYHVGPGAPWTPAGRVGRETAALAPRPRTESGR